jgi:hypothetical protein
MIRSFAVSVFLIFGSVVSAEIYDVGLRDSSTNLSQVIFAEGDLVFLRTCIPPLAKPNRDCETDTDMISIDRQSFLKSLKFETGFYDINADGLSLVKQDLQAAETAASSGNVQAEAEAKRLRTIVANIDRLLAIESSLEEGIQTTYYQYQDDYRLLLSGFSSGVATKFYDSITDQTFVLFFQAQSQQDAQRLCEELVGGEYKLPGIGDLKQNDVYKRISSRFSSLLVKLTTFGGTDFYALWTSDFHEDAEDCYSTSNGVCGHSFRIRVEQGSLCNDDPSENAPYCKYYEHPRTKLNVVCLKSGN